MTHSSGSSTVVLGGGVIGAACAYYLAKSGRSVVLIDRGEFGGGCSHGNCGLIVPSHVLPLAEPGAVRKTLALMMQRNSPVAVKTRFDPALWGWLFRFARQCNERDMLAAAKAQAPLLQSARSLYDELMAGELTECDWETAGGLFLFRSADQWKKYGETDRLLTDNFDIRAEAIPGEELCEREPALKPGLAGGWFYEVDAQLRPDRLMQAWRRVLTELGVTIHERCEAVRLITEGRRMIAVETPPGDIQGDAFVLATGVETIRFAPQVGCKLPIAPGKGYSVTMPRPTVCPAAALHFVEHKVVVTPFASGYRIGSTMEFAGYDRRVDPKRIDQLKQAAAVYLKEPTCEPVEETWTGLRPMVYDGRPIIGPAPAINNLWVASGHGMLGVSMAPSTGKLIAEMVNEETPHVDPAPLSPQRFG